MSVQPLSVTLRHPAHVPVDPASALVYLACAAGVFALTKRRPALGVAALLLLAPFDVARYVGPTTITTLKAGLLGLLAALALGRPDFAALATFPVRAMLAGFFAVLAAIALSATHAASEGAVARELLKNVEYLVLWLGAVVAYATDPDDRPFWRALELAVTLVCLSALAEYVVGAHSGIFVHGRSVPRIAGALEGPNQLAGYLGIALPVLTARLLVHRDRLLAAVVGLAALTDLLTVSRSGVMGGAIGVVTVLVLLRPPSVTIWRVVAAGAAVCALALAGALRAGLPAGYFSLDQAPQSADHLANRAMLWKAAIELWRSSPFVGVGAGNYELDLPLVGLSDVRTHANSIYLQFLSETGLVGLGALLLSLGITVLTLARSAVRRPLVVGALGATAALASHQIFDDMFFFPKVATAYWLVTGVAVAEVAARRLFERRRSAVRAATSPA